MMNKSVAILISVALAMGACSSTPEQDPKTVAGTEFQDCPGCPVMITVPAGSFMMGTAAGQELIDPRTGQPATNDQPQHTVNLPANFAIGKYEVTTGQYSEFVAATGYAPAEACMNFSVPESFVISDETNWSDTGFPQTSSHPVVCVSFFDALAYTVWLSETTGQSYRLPSEAEWEYAARAGTTTPYYWGTDESMSCDYSNVRSKGADTISTRQAESDVDDGFPCNDNSIQSSAVGTYLPNDFNLYDMLGNVWEWAADCNHKDYVGAPADGSAWVDDPQCRFGVIRSGSFLNRVERSSVTVRAGRPRSGRATNMGFRVVRDFVTENSMVESTDNSPAFGSTDQIDISVPGAQLFADNCAACHQESTNLSGLYGKDQDSLVRAITYGGNNVMSMPAFGERLTADEIDTLATYLRDVNNWN